MRSFDSVSPRWFGWASLWSLDGLASTSGRNLLFACTWFRHESGLCATAVEAITVIESITVIEPITVIESVTVIKSVAVIEPIPVAVAIAVTIIIIIIIIITPALRN